MSNGAEGGNACLDLPRHLAGTLDDDEAHDFEQHLLVCGKCRRRWERAAAMELAKDAPLTAGDEEG